MVDQVTLNASVTCVCVTTKFLENIGQPLGGRIVENSMVLPPCDVKQSQRGGALQGQVNGFTVRAGEA